MNKYRRHELKILKYKKRLKQLNLDPNELNANFNSYRSHGKPCSCNLCRDEKFRNTSRKQLKLIKVEELVSEIE